MANHELTELPEELDGRKVTIPGEPWKGPNIAALAQIVKDLWGTQAAGAPASAPAAQPDAPGPQAAQPDAPRAQAKTDAPRPQAPRAAFPPFEKFWRVCDEEIEWTVALVRETAPDGAIPQRLWDICHREAPEVLQGSVDAYLSVLDQIQPLEDLKPYAQSFEVAVENQEHLLCAFEGNPAYMQKSLKELRRYLAGMSLRVARDLMALLPVSSVTVIGRFQGENLLAVTYQRQQLRVCQFRTADPEQVAREMGAVFGEMDDDGADGAGTDSARE